MNPIDLLKVQQKLKTDSYEDVEDLTADIELIVNNAKAFYKPDSTEYQDACQLLDVFNTNKKRVLENQLEEGCMETRPRKITRPRKSLTTEDDEFDEGSDFDPYEELFAIVMTATDPLDNHDLHHMFQLLPSKKLYPGYYDIIDHPIDLKLIATKIQTSAYSNLNEMEKDLLQMTKNACTFNEPGSQIYKDAKMLKKIFMARKADIESGRYRKPPTKRPRLASSAMARVARDSKSIGSPSQNCSLNNTLASKSNRVMPGTSLKKKLLSLHEFLVGFTYDDHQPMALFMEKPSKKLYPDYYQVIQHPIDMTTIENNIKADRYSTIDDIVGDYRLMFSNCRKYNEEGSMIYDDANILEKALNDKLKEFSGISKKLNLSGKINTTPLEIKLKQMYDTIREYREPKQNRQLSYIFMKLPSKSEYPDYYDIIKDPIDIEKIEKKLRQQAYDSVDDMAADFMLMFENACKYNEPDSQIYKDALCLQQLLIQTKQALRSEETVPNVQQAVQELLLSLFTTFYNYQDEEGRCYSDSLAELVEYDECDGNRVRAISLDLIKRRLDKGLYKRLDIFQEDIFSCLERARRLSRTDSQVFEDSIELQSFFIKKRDELCQNGNVLESPALSYNTMHLSAAVESLRQSKLLQEEETDTDNDAVQASQGESMTIDQKVFSPGDFVYIDLPENKIPGIMYIERLWTTADNIKMMNGLILLRPHETFHVQTRKFMEQELFKSDQHVQIPLSKALNKCFVMHVRDYVKLMPEHFASKDVFVCESRYSSKARSFKKLKTWNLVRANDPVKLIPREATLEVKRVIGKVLFRGPWLLTPPEVPGTISRLFYRQEVLLSTIQETTSAVAIVGRCAVLDQNEYITRRPTEIAEADVYMCESIFDEFKKQIRKIVAPSGLRKFTHSQMVSTDEVYHFRRPINPPKV
uniref:Protein polybromo-1 n=1 Tax=Anopheles maculatus TaxID=74869 RepID=A0A182SV47_9DIPT